MGRGAAIGSAGQPARGSGERRFTPDSDGCGAVVAASAAVAVATAAFRPKPGQRDGYVWYLRSLGIDQRTTR